MSYSGPLFRLSLFPADVNRVLHIKPNVLLLVVHVRENIQILILLPEVFRPAIPNGHFIFAVQRSALQLVIKFHIRLMLNELNRHLFIVAVSLSVRASLGLSMIINIHRPMLGGCCYKCDCHSEDSCDCSAGLNCSKVSETGLPYFTGLLFSH